MKKVALLISTVLVILLVSACSKSNSPIPKEQFVVGNHVAFGNYSETNEKKPINWIVLEVQDNQALLISQYGIVSRQYNKVYKNVTWETSDIRQWLNETFYNKAFTAAEKNRILLTDVDNSKSQGFEYNNTKGGNNTQDFVFLLSYSEKERYFPDFKSAKCYSNSKKNSACSWWLRSPGIYQHSAICVRTSGSTGSKEVDLTGNYVRPAIWLNLGE